MCRAFLSISLGRSPTFRRGCCTKCRKAIAEAGGVDVLLDLVRQSHIESYQCAAEAAETALVNMMGYTTEVAKSRKRGRED